MQTSFHSFALAALLGLGTLSLAQDVKQKPAQKTEPAVVKEEIPQLFELGKKIDPAIELTDVTGKKHKFADFAGKTVVLDFWSMNCPWSRAYEKRLISLHETYSSKGVVFLAIDSNHTDVKPDAADPYADIKAYVEKEKVPFPILIDTGNVIADRFQALTTPHVFIINGEGVLQYNGGVDDDPEQKKAAGEYAAWATTALDEVMAKKPVTQARTKPKGCSIKRVNAAQN